VADGETLVEPEIAFPVEKPVPVHEAAFVEDHVRVDEPPCVIDVGFADNDAVG
jgi:hypothetical protein